MSTAGQPPLALALGLGCDRGTPSTTLAAAVDAALATVAAAHPGRSLQVEAVASINLKADEAGLLELAAARGWHIVFHPPAALAGVAVPNPSPTVLRHTGTPSVAEAAALLAAGRSGQAAPMRCLLVDKYRLSGPDGRHATVSIARIET